MVAIVDDADEPFQGRKLVWIISLQLGQQCRDPGGPVLTHPLCDTCWCTNEIRETAEVERHRLAGFFSLPALPQLGDDADLFAVAQPGERVVVEVATVGTHRSDGERVAVGVPSGRSVGGRFVVVDLDRDRRNEIKIRQRASSALRAFAQGTQKYFGGFGNERVAKPAVGRLTGESQ